MRPEDRIGQKFGKWTIVRSDGYQATNNLHFLCRCDCGEERVIPSANLYMGKSRQCHGCACRARVARRAKANRAEAEAAGYKIIRMDGGVPILACADCGKALNPAAHTDGTRHCHKCFAKHCQQPAWHFYPLPLRVIAEASGLSKQRIHQMVQGRGFEGMLQHLEERGLIRVKRE